ncbi:unnamed protein product [Adineta steineri]|uniref:Uncharacterized protein n=1 Tax=Adineta steineri TaxID=433720 RepID=A0A818HC45_9BILA|nr:unnamed protein product [Adineta steineri]CAF3506007.1 unnamed protein product [Adineta steineri]
MVFAYSYLINYRYTWYYRYNTNEEDLHIEMNQQFRYAEIYWNQLIRKQELNSNYNFTSDICTILITSPRNRHPTLHYTLSSLVSSMTHEDKLKTKIFIYNSAMPPSLHKYAEQLSQAKLTFLEIINSSSIHFDFVHRNVKFNSQSDQWAFNEALDYLIALSICEKQNSSNILILQDDLIFTKNFFEKLRTTISNNDQHCSLIKLFQTDYWDGWERKDGPRLILFSLFISILINLIFLLTDYKISLRFIRLNTKIFVTFLLFSFLWFLFILIILLSVNHQNLQFIYPFKHEIYIMQTSTAGALAQIYSSNVVKPLKLFLLKQINSNQSIPIDIQLNQFFEEYRSSFLQCHATPDLVNHIGVYSSNTNKNQGNFLVMKKSGTFENDQASLPLTFE